MKITLKARALCLIISLGIVTSMASFHFTLAAVGTIETYPAASPFDTNKTDMLHLWAVAHTDDDSGIAEYVIQGYGTYQFQAGDKLTYDIFLDAEGPDGTIMGGTNMVCGAIDGTVGTAKANVRDSGFVTSDGIDVVGYKDLTEIAFRKWKTMIANVPQALVGQPTDKWTIITFPKSTRAGTHLTKSHAYFDNIKIIGADGSVKQNIYTDGNVQLTEKTRYNIAPGGMGVSVVNDIPSTVRYDTIPTADPKINNETDMVKITCNSANNSDSIALLQYKINKPLYTVQNGDYLTYDVFMDADAPADTMMNTGSAENNNNYLSAYIELRYGVNGANLLRDSASITDQNYMSVKGDATAYRYSFRKWQTRKLELTSIKDQEITDYFFASLQPSSSAGNKVTKSYFYFDNVKICHADGTATMDIYADGDLAFYNNYDGTYDTRYNVDQSEAIVVKGKAQIKIEDVPATQPTDINKTDMIHLWAIANTDEDTGIAEYEIKGNGSYQFQAGDKLTYDIFLDAEGPDGTIMGDENMVCGAIDGTIGTAKANVRDSGFVTTDGIAILGYKDLSEVAFRKWKTMIANVPQALVGQPTDKWTIITFPKSTRAGTHLTKSHAYFDNIKIIGADGSVKQNIYTDGNVQLTEKTRYNIAPSGMGASVITGKASEVRFDTIPTANPTSANKSDMIKIWCTPASHADTGALLQYKINKPSYTVQSGDYLTYDIFMDAEAPANTMMNMGGAQNNNNYISGYIEARYGANGVNLFRDNAAITDADGMTLRCDATAFQNSFRKWNTRVIALTPIAEQEITQWFFASLQPSKSAGNAVTKTILCFDNVKVCHADGTVALDIYSDGNMTFYNQYNGVVDTRYNVDQSEATVVKAATNPENPPVTEVKIEDVAKVSPSKDNKTDMLMIETTPDGNGDNFGLATYAINPGKTYTFVDGDYIQYDLFLDAEAPNGTMINIGGAQNNNNVVLGYLEGEWKNGIQPMLLRDVLTLQDQNGIGVRGNANMLSKAFRQWYTRKIPVTPELTDREMTKFLLTNLQASLSAGNKITKSIVYMDNIKICHANGTVAFEIYTDGDIQLKSVDQFNVRTAAARVIKANAGDNPNTADRGILACIAIFICGIIISLIFRKRKIYLK